MKVKRISIVAFVDADDLTANQIMGSVEAHLKKSFNIPSRDVEHHYRVVERNSWVKENGRGEGI